ncbi:MAG: GNAT family N-acetyltransferase [Candidatus Hodarchaeota archaeon]
MKRSKIKALYEFNGRYLCPIEKEFLPKLKEWRNLQIKLLRQFKPLTSYDQEKWFEKLSEDENQVLFGIVTVGEKGEKKALIGYCGITNIDFKNRRGEISFLVGPDRADDEKLYREDFLSTLYMLCKYGFEELNLNKLFTETFSFRKNHLKILEEFGFNRDGILRNHHFTCGRHYDSIIHSLLASEWKKIKNEMEK